LKNFNEPNIKNNDSRVTEMQSNINQMSDDICQLKEFLNYTNQSDFNGKKNNMVDIDNERRIDIKNFMSSIEGDLNYYKSTFNNSSVEKSDNKSPTKRNQNILIHPNGTPNDEFNHQ